jgi:hypothetical protein
MFQHELERDDDHDLERRDHDDELQRRYHDDEFEWHDHNEPHQHYGRWRGSRAVHGQATGK